MISSDLIDRFGGTLISIWIGQTPQALFPALQQPRSPQKAHLGRLLPPHPPSCTGSPMPTKRVSPSGPQPLLPLTKIKSLHSNSKTQILSINFTKAPKTGNRKSWSKTRYAKPGIPVCMEQKECKLIFESPDPWVDRVPDLFPPVLADVLMQAQVVFALCMSTAYSSAFFILVVPVLCSTSTATARHCVTFSLCSPSECTILQHHAPLSNSSPPSF